MKRRLKQQLLHRTHPFLDSIGFQEAWLVVDLDQWKSGIKNEYGGVRPLDRTIRGHLWSTEVAATEAARFILKGNPTRIFGIMELTSVVELTTPPITITKIGRK